MRVSAGVGEGGGGEENTPGVGNALLGLPVGCAGGVPQKAGWDLVLPGSEWVLRSRG